MANPPARRPGASGKASRAQVPAPAALQAQKDEERDRVLDEAEELLRGAQVQTHQARRRREEVKRRLEAEPSAESDSREADAAAARDALITTVSENTGLDERQEQILKRIENLILENAKLSNKLLSPQESAIVSPRGKANDVVSAYIIQNIFLVSLLRNHVSNYEDALRNLLDNIGVARERHDLIVQVVVAACEGDEARLTAMRRALEAPAAEVSAPPPLRLPDEIPKAQWYGERPKGQTLRQFFGLDPNPPEFKEGWPAPYIRAKILSLPELKRLDPTSHTALYHTKEGKALRRDLLPRKQDLVTEQVSHLDRQLIREARRLESAERRRRQ